MASATQQVRVTIVGAESAIKSLERVIAVLVKVHKEKKIAIGISGQQAVTRILSNVDTAVKKIPKDKAIGMRLVGASNALTSFAKIKAGLAQIPIQKQLNFKVSGISKTAAEIDRTANSIKKVGTASESAKSGPSSLSSFAVAKFAIIGDIAIGVARKVGEAFTEAWNYASVMQKSEVSWQKLAGSDAPQILDLMKDRFTKLPYPIEDVSNSLMMMYTSGIKAADLPKTLKSISDTAAASTAPDALNRITRGLTQMVAKQRVTSEEMMQLNEAGINGWDLLANAIGKTGPEIRQMSEDGKLGINEVNILIDELGKRYEGLAEQQAKATLSGQWQLLKNEITQGLAPAFEKLQKALVPVVQYIRTNIVPAISKAGESFAGFVEKVVNESGKILEPLTKIKDKIGGFLFKPEVKVEYKETGSGELITANETIGKQFEKIETKTGKLKLNMDNVASASNKLLGIFVAIGTFKFGMSLLPMITQITGLISKFGLLNVASAGISVIGESFAAAGASALALLNPVTLVVAASELEGFTRAVAMFSATSGIAVDTAATAFGRLR